MPRPEKRPGLSLPRLSPCKSLRANSLAPMKSEISRPLNAGRAPCYCVAAAAAATLVHAVQNGEVPVAMLLPDVQGLLVHIFMSKAPHPSFNHAH